MAYTARASATGALGDAENAKPVAGKSGLAAAPRRALGEIGNVLGGALTSRAGKESSKAGGGTLTERQAPSGNRDVGLLLNRIRESAKRSASANVSAWGAHKQRSTTYKPRETASPLAGRARLDGAQSLSRLLQKHSEEENLPDIDSADKHNPLAATEYVNCIYNYYRRVEPDTNVEDTYMLSQADINDKMRAILIDWLVEVHLKFKLMPETLFLTVNLIDRFLAKKSVSRKNLQLVGVTAMLLASKYEEIWAPEVRDFVYISDKAYTREQILAMEKQMLNTLNFQLTVPTPHQFMARYLKAAGADKQHSLLTSYLVEISLPDYSMLKYSGSLLSAAAVYAANRVLNKPQWWGHVLEAHTRYSEQDVLPVANLMVKLMRKASTANLTAVYKKYSNQKFMEVAKLPAPSGLGDDH